MAWTWDLRKAIENRARHGVSFDVAKLVFDDPLHLSQPDPHPDGDRWQTIGLVEPVLLFVVHTILDEDEPGGRIISARRATPRERRSYEEGD